MGKENSTKKLIWFWIFLLLLGTAGIFLYVYSTPFGIGLVNDSVGYISGARNILAGNGYSRLTGNGSPAAITNYPPLFSMVIAVISAGGMDAIRAAWLLNGFLMGLNIFLLGIVLKRVTKNWIWALLGTALYMLSTPVLASHVYAMSEPLFLALSFTFFLVFESAWGQKIWVWMVLAGCLVGLAFLARLVGLALLGTGLVTIWVFGLDKKMKLRESLYLLLGSLPMIGGWFIRNALVSDTLSNRNFQFHLIPIDKWLEGLYNFWGWLLPETGGLIEKTQMILGVIFGAGFLAILVGLVKCAIHHNRDGNQAQSSNFILSWLTIAYGVGYPVVVVLTLIFIDASPIFEDRIILPMEVSLLVGMVIGLDWVWARRSLLFRVACCIAVIGLSLSLVEDMKDRVQEYRQDGQGFASQAWQASETIQYLRDTDKKPILYSNRQTAVYLLSGHPAYYLPSPLNPATGQPRENYEKDVAAIRKAILEGHGWMVIFDYRLLLDTPEETAWVETLSKGLPVLKETKDGIILGIVP